MTMINKSRWNQYHAGLLGGQDLAEEILADLNLLGTCHPLSQEFHEINDKVNVLFAPLIAKLAGQMDNSE